MCFDTDCTVFSIFAYLIFLMFCLLIILEMPSTLDITSIQRIGNIKEGKSPNPPPRQRQNPFNKNLPNYESNFHYQHQRSQSVKCTSDTTRYFLKLNLVQQFTYILYYK